MEGWITTVAKFKIPKEQNQLQWVQCNSNFQAPPWLNAYSPVPQNWHSLACLYLQVRNDHWELYKIEKKNRKSNGSFWQINLRKYTGGTSLRFVLLHILLNGYNHVHSHLLVLPSLWMQVQAFNCFAVNFTDTTPSHAWFPLSRVFRILQITLRIPK